MSSIIDYFLPAFPTIKDQLDVNIEEHSSHNSVNPRETQELERKVITTTYFLTPNNPISSLIVNPAGNALASFVFEIDENYELVSEGKRSFWQGVGDTFIDSAISGATSFNSNLIAEFSSYAPDVLVRGAGVLWGYVNIDFTFDGLHRIKDQFVDWDE